MKKDGIKRGRGLVVLFVAVLFVGCNKQTPIESSSQASQASQERVTPDQEIISVQEPPPKKGIQPSSPPPAN